MTTDITAPGETVIHGADSNLSNPATKATESNGPSENGFAYEVPRPFLTLQQAAAILGKSLRSLERSLLGRWGNKLPDGWTARKMKTENGDEWRIIPPPGFRVRQFVPSESDDDTADGAEQYERVEGIPSMSTSEFPGLNLAPQRRRSQPWRPDKHTMDHPSIVIDRTEEVEYLLRDLVSCQRSLAEERRLHMEDLRMIAQLQGSLRLLESSTSEQARLKAELEATKQELSNLKQQYNEITNLPWWKRLFKGGP